MIPSIESVQRERAALAADSQRGAITDPVITPFVRALKFEGFQIKSERSGCDTLGTCPKCQGRYLYTALKGGIKHSLCPHCHDAQMRKLIGNT